MKTVKIAEIRFFEDNEMERVSIGRIIKEYDAEKSAEMIENINPFLLKMIRDLEEYSKVEKTRDYDEKSCYYVIASDSDSRHDICRAKILGQWVYAVGFPYPFWQPTELIAMPSGRNLIFDAFCNRSLLERSMDAEMMKYIYGLDRA